MSDFEQQVAAWVAKVKAKSERVCDAVADEVFKRVKERTPVDTGALRDAWVLERKDSRITITNGKPYARVVEYGMYPRNPVGGEGKTSNGFSTQAPSGMVGVTIEELPQILKQVKEDLK